MRDWRSLLNGDQRHCPPSFECCARRGIAALDCWTRNTTFLGGGLSSIQVLYKRTTALLDERVASTAGWWAYALSASIRADPQLLTAKLPGERERGHYWMMGIGAVRLHSSRSAILQGSGTAAVLDKRLASTAEWFDALSTSIRVGPPLRAAATLLQCWIND